MEKENLGDWELISRKELTNEAFAILFKRHKDFVYRLAIGFTCDPDLADEVTQEVFVRMYEGRKRWRPRAKFTTWIYRMTLNTSRELLRKSKRERKKLHRVLLEAPDRPETPSDISRVSELENILRALPDRQREAVVLRFYEKLSVKETAKIMGCREGTIKSHLHKALNNLRGLLSP
jgi:RNA polymerase sigma-70 factor (ECF subfamily)